MKQPDLRTLASALLCAVMLAGAPSAKAATPGHTKGSLTVQASKADEQAIRTLIERYRATVETLDQQAIEGLWVHDAQVTFIHPRGHERGWDGVWQHFYQGTMGLFSERQFNVHDIHVFQHGSVAYVEFYWDFLATFKTGGEPLRTQGRENQLLVRTPSGWRISNVHYSGMPVTGERQGF